MMRYEGPFCDWVSLRCLWRIRGRYRALTPKAAAAEAGRRFSTVRTYLNRIFRKAGTNQQSQLVALLKSAHPFQR
jgi:DNA-binding CsgD family transcriptional regulator